MSIDLKILTFFGYPQFKISARIFSTENPVLYEKIFQMQLSNKKKPNS